MKKQISRLLLLGISVLAISACTKTDNFEGPDASFEGRIIDASTGENLQTETGSVQIRLEQTDWETTASPQTIPSKYDGTFKDTKLFKGKYKVVPTNGAFWPVYDTVTVDIGNSTKHDFEVTPYVKINDLTATMNGTTLILNFSWEPPIPAGLPNIRTIQPFVNITKLVGSGATIRDYSLDFRTTVNRPWEEIPPVPVDLNGNGTIDQNENYGRTMSFEIPNILKGRTYYVRIGVQLNDSFTSWNLSNILEVQVPNE